MLAHSHGWGQSPNSLQETDQSSLCQRASSRLGWLHWIRQEIGLEQGRNCVSLHRNQRRFEGIVAEGEEWPREIRWTSESRHPRIPTADHRKSWHSDSSVWIYFQLDPHPRHYWSPDPSIVFDTELAAQVTLGSDSIRSPTHRFDETDHSLYSIDIWPANRCKLLMSIIGRQIWEAHSGIIWYWTRVLSFHKWPIRTGWITSWWQSRLSWALRQIDWQQDSCIASAIQKN